MRYEIKELNVGGVLDQAIKLTKNHFKLLFLITLVLKTPFDLISGFLISFATPTIAAGSPPAPGSELAFFNITAMLGGLLVSLLNGVFVYPLTLGAITHAIASVYLDKPTSVRNSFARAFRVLGPLIVTSILVYLIYSVGFILCLVPGIIAYFFLILTTQIVVIEGVWGVDALKRSRELMKGNMLTAFVLLLLVTIISFGVGMGGSLAPQKQIGAVCAALLQSVIFVFSSAAWVAFYFSCRCKVENFDLAILADAVAQDDPALDPTAEGP